MAKFKFNIKRRRKTLLERKSSEPGFTWHTCKNCEYKFEGNYCPSCGQSILEVQKPVTHFLRDMLDSLLVFDIRIIKSLPTLLLKPGKISTEFVAGKRKKYVPPFRFFLFASILFFFLISLQTRNLFNTEMNNEQRAVMVDSVLNEMEIRGQFSESGDTILAISNLREGLGLYEILKNSLRDYLSNSPLTQKERTKYQQFLNSMENPNYITSQIYKYISWSFFILMPFYALILRLFFRKQRKYYVEHLVFSVNLHTFYFILLTIILLLNMIFENILKGMAPWILLVAFTYALVGIRTFYKKRWFSSFLYALTTFIIYFFSSVILITAAAITVITILWN